MTTGHAVEVFGITLVGATPENGKKLLLTIVLMAVLLLFSMVVRRLLARTRSTACASQNRHPAAPRWPDHRLEFATPPGFGRGFLDDVAARTSRSAATALRDNAH